MKRGLSIGTGFDRTLQDSRRLKKGWITAACELSRRLRNCRLGVKTKVTDKCWLGFEFAGHARTRRRGFNDSEFYDLILGSHSLMRSWLFRFVPRIQPLFVSSLYLSGAVLVLNIQLTHGHSIPYEVLQSKCLLSSPVQLPRMPSLLTDSVKSLYSRFHYLPNLDSLLYQFYLLPIMKSTHHISISTLSIFFSLFLTSSHQRGVRQCNLSLSFPFQLHICS